jgi:hypothetical protein
MEESLLNELRPFQHPVVELQCFRRQLSRYGSSAMHDASRFTNDIRALSLARTTKTTNLRRLIRVQFCV